MLACRQIFTSLASIVVCYVSASMRILCVLFCMRSFLEEVKQPVSEWLLERKNHLTHSKDVREAVREVDSQLKLIAISYRWYASHPDDLAPLQDAAATGEGHVCVPGQQGLPFRLESSLEGGRSHELWGDQEPGGDRERRPLQLEQHPDAPCRSVDGVGLCDLPGHPGLAGSSLRDAEGKRVSLVLSEITRACYWFYSASALLTPPPPLK